MLKVINWINLNPWKSFIAALIVMHIISNAMIATEQQTGQIPSLLFGFGIFFDLLTIYTLVNLVSGWFKKKRTA